MPCFLPDCHSKQYTRNGGWSITDGQRRKPRELYPERKNLQILLTHSTDRPPATQTITTGKENFPILLGNIVISITTQLLNITVYSIHVMEV